MSLQSMQARDGQSRWPYSAYSRVTKANLSDAKQHVCMRIPREAFRQAAMCFNETRQSSQVARYWEMMLQLFLEMCQRVDNAVKNGDIKGEAVKVYPVQKVYIEWIPSENDPEKACEYRIHAFLLVDHPDLSYGKYLSIVLNDNESIRKDANERTINSRKPDVLSALQEYQHFRKVTKEVYFRNICGLAYGHRIVENNLDAVNMLAIYDVNNVANPLHIWSVENACNNCTNPNFKEVMNSFCNNVFEFENLSRVIRLTPEQMFPKVFSTKYLPDYQAFLHKHVKPTKYQDMPSKPSHIDIVETGNGLTLIGKDDAVRPDDHRLDLNTFTEYDMRTVTEQEQERIEKFSTRSDFQLMADFAKNHYQENYQKYENTQEYNEQYKIYQKWAMNELKSRCLNPDANISEKGKIILRWASERTPPEYKVLRKYNKNLSLFANRIIKIMEEAEQLYLISTAHREFYQVMHARLDAYRRSFGLHFNIFQTGEGATSKSFLFDLMKHASIHGTVDQLTYETAKANAVDGNRNDVITVCHEAPPGMFQGSKLKKNDPTMQSAFKERLTSQHVSCKTFYMDEATGKRSQRNTKSECIGVWMGATNDDPDDVEEALKTRFYWGNFEKQKRMNKDIDDCINGERSLSRADRERREIANLEWKEEQYRVFLIEKMIWTGVIKDVEMSAYYVLKQRFKKLYQGESVRVAETRDWERVHIFARVQAICTALAAVFQVEGGKYYGVPFEEEQLLAVEPYLVVTEEMVFFTLTMLDNQFVHPAEHKILNKLHNLYKNVSTGRFGQPKPEESPNSISYDYLKICGNIQKIAKRIHTSLTASEGKTSLHNIQAFLAALTRTGIKAYRYRLAESSEIQWPEPILSGKKQLAMCAHITPDALFIHMSLILAHSGKNHDPVLETIRNIQHQYQREKSIMVARRYNVFENKRKVTLYNVFRTIDRHPTPGKFIKFRNVLFNSDVSKSILNMSGVDDSRSRPEIVIHKDIDDYALQKREEDLGYAIESYETFGKQGVHINYPSCMYKRKRSDSDMEENKRLKN